MGNSATSAGLRVSSPSDRLEREAEVMARRVLGSSVASPVPSVSEDGDSGDRVMRCAGGCHCDDVIHRSHAEANGGTVGRVTRADIGRLGSGRGLPERERSFFEPRFGADLSQVRIHDGPVAAGLSDRVGAKAFTFHQDVVFGKGQYQPATQSGRMLLAHELGHTRQQKEGAVEAPATILRGEKLDAIFGVGPWDAWKAKGIADSASKKAQKYFPGSLHNGAGDAWRHCYWNCAMTGELGAKQAKEVADNHEKHGKGPALENQMDLHNNAAGRACGGKACDACCQGKLDTGKLRVLSSSGKKLTPSIKTHRGTAPSTSDPRY